MSLGRYAFCLLIPAIPLCQARADRWADSLTPERQLLYLRSGDDVRRLFPGFEGLMADVYWLRTVQYYGGQRAFATEKHYELLRPLIDITTSLDPRLELAYRYGAIFLSESAPFGAGKPLEGVEVLERGVRALPASWRLRWDLGSLWYFFMGDQRRAAQVLVEASKIEGAPYWLFSLAGSILVKEDRVVAREIWRRQYENGEETIKENAAYHLQILDALDTRDALAVLVKTFTGNEGRPPGSLSELVSAGLTPSIPRDPAGVEFAYDPQTGKVQISRASRLWRSKYEGE